MECGAIACDPTCFSLRSVDLQMNLAIGAIAQGIARSLICHRPRYVKYRLILSRCRKEERHQ
eukprot:4995747-Lingulodinium_polyedra.AAC.1